METPYPDMHDAATQILNAIPVACYQLNQHRQVTYVNRRAELFFAMDKGQMLGSNIWTLFPEAVNTPYFQAIEEAFEQKRQTTDECVSPLTGTWIRLTATPHGDGVIVSFIDIGSEKKVEKALVNNKPKKDMSITSRC
jgi:PAS domain-containing protein